MNDTEIAKQKKALRERGICVVIPTYNNGGTVGDVVKDTLRYCDDVIVVNDGSTDDTDLILNDIDNIHIVQYEKNRGKGYALKAGFRKAIELGFSYAITLDSDAQHYPADIALFLKANREHPGALIIGERSLEGVERSKGSSFANKFSNFWFCIQTGKNLHDTQTGYRLYPLKKLVGLSLLTSRYEAELELLVFASWHGVKIVSTPVNVYYPPAKERVSHFRPTMDFARISVLNTVLCLLAIVYGAPLRLWRTTVTALRTVYSLLFFLFFMLCVFSPWVWIVTHFGKMTERKRRHLHWLIYAGARMVMIHHGIPGTKFRYKLDKAVDFDKPHIIICNHQSHLDLMCQLIFTPKIVFLTKEWVYNNPLYGSLIRHAEYLPVMNGIDELLPQLHSLVERGYSIAVYPEGTRSKDCSIGRFHQGAFYMAEQLGLDIIPMYLYGAGKILKKKTYHLNKGLIYIEADSPIRLEDLKKIGEHRQQAKYMRRMYMEKYEEISNRIERNI